MCTRKAAKRSRATSSRSTSPASAPFEGGSSKGFFLELGSNQFIPGFEEQLVGAKAGESREVNVTFPKDYHSADLAGAPVVFDVTVHEVHHLHVPEIDEKLAKELGFKDLEALKGAVRQQVGFEYERLARGKAKKQLFDLLDEEVKFDVPPKMLELEFDAIWKQVEDAKKAGDPSLKDRPEAELKKEYEAIAKRRVKLGILLSEVGRANNLQISREELSAAVMSQARNFPGEEEKVFEFYRKNPAQIDELKGPILEEKAVDFILSKAKRNKKPITLEALRSEDEEEASGDGKAKKAKSKKA
ncbi:MAG: trigger factor [Alphaproteobacteria bacterium]